MARERKIIGIWPAGQSEASSTDDVGAQTASTEAELLTVDKAINDAATAEPIDYIGQLEPDTLWLDQPEAESKSPSIAWLLLTIVAVLGWGAWTAWSASRGFSFLPNPVEIYYAASQFLIPAMLMALLWLVGAHIGGRGAARHLRLLAKVRLEQQHLDNRLAAIGQHWLDAHERLVTRSHAMAEEMLTASSQLDSTTQSVDERMRAAVIAASEVSDHGQAARRHMEGLILALPKVDETARRMADTIKAAGQSAYQYGGQLEERMAQLRVEMTEAETVASQVHATVSQQVADISQAKTAVDRAAMAASDRFAATLGQQRDAALSLLVELAASLENHASQTEERFGKARAAFDAAGIAQLDTIEQRVVDANRAAADLDARLNTSAQSAATVDAAVADAIRQASERLAVMDASTTASRQQFADLVDGISNGTDAIEQRMSQAHQQAADHVAHASTVQSALETAAAAAETRLPAALAAFEQAQRAGQHIISELEGRLHQAMVTASAMNQRFDDSGQSLERHADLLQSMQASAESMHEQYQRQIDALTERMDALSLAMRGQMSDWTSAVETARDQLKAAADGHGEHLDQAINNALARATGPEVEARLNSIATAAIAAVAQANTVSTQLAQQVERIDQACALLAERASSAQAKVDSRSSDTLARLVARTNEALQSTAVDLTRLLSADVSDLAWEAYLKGDRGVFARRAVRLLNNAEARDVLARYQNDDDFRALVNRYIHDFETILRNVMDTRDGAALSVTLLSSDIGKVYVALAQAIERLRN